MRILQKKVGKFNIIILFTIIIDASYDFFSDYGRYIFCSLFFLLFFIISFILIYLILLPLCDFDMSARVAVAGAIPFFPVAHFDDNALQEVLKESSFGAVYYVFIVQQILNSILLFLIGLGLRNRFRI